MKKQIQAIFQYRQSALHWNRSLFESRFTEIFQTALKSYQGISQTTGVQVHSQLGMDRFIAKIEKEYEEFKNLSLKSSERAVGRELQTQHRLEHLTSATKARLLVKNYLGGVYHLTADEIILENDNYVIQESKNTTSGMLPSISDIKDGLFKLILYANFDTLSVAYQNVQFKTRLKLTGVNIQGSLKFPQASETEMKQFIQANEANLTSSAIELLSKLKQEAQNNRKLEIMITSNDSN